MAAIFLGLNVLIDTLRPQQDGHHFVDDTFKPIFLNENDWILLQISLEFVPKVPTDNRSALIQLTWNRWQAINWTNDEEFTDTYMSSGPNVLTRISYLFHYTRNEHSQIRHRFTSEDLRAKIINRPCCPGGHYCNYQTGTLSISQVTATHEDRVPVDFICRCPLNELQWLDIEDSIPAWYSHKWLPGETPHSLVQKKYNSSALTRELRHFHINFLTNTLRLQQNRCILQTAISS